MEKGMHIVLDGYLSSNTKDHCYRKNNPIQSNAIELTSSMLLDGRKDLFLLNNGNKQMFYWLSNWSVLEIMFFSTLMVLWSSAIELAEEWTMYVFMLVTQILYCSSTSWNYLPQIQQNIGWTEDEMQLSTIHWEFIILCKNGEGLTWTQRSKAFSILMPNSSLLRTLNHWDQEIYIRSFFATAQSLLANQVLQKLSVILWWTVWLFR